MEWQNLSFLLVFVLTEVVKGFWLKPDSPARDKILPVVAFAAALLIRFVEGLGGEVPQLGTALTDTALAMGLKGAVNWGKALPK